jgi:hypothetical protein
MRLGKPEGNGTLQREITANLQVERMCKLLSALMYAGGYFTLENPHSSYIFSFGAMLPIRSRHDVFLYSFDQCRFGMQLPGAESHTFCRKRTSILTNIPCLRVLEGFCEGISSRHQHEACWGTRKVGGKNVNLCAAAGLYPTKLCNSIAGCVHQHISTLT